MKARQLLSWYTISQNQKLSPDNGPLDPLWVRCDMSDPSGTSWLGAETVHLANKVTGVKLYSVTCKGPSVERKSFITLEDLKQEHKKRHHPFTCPQVAIKGNASYNLFGSTVVENTTIESQSSVTVDFRWSHVESVLETPPLSSKATLKIKITCGDMRSPMFQMYTELEFLQSESDIFNSMMERGNLDFVEQIWVRMRKSVTSYQDVHDCLKLVIDRLSYGDLKPWIHRDSNNSLGKAFLQSYREQIDHVSLTGLTPISMLLEIGLDKMRKDYINYLIGTTNLAVVSQQTANCVSFYLA
ncbi:hypothetical protein CRUP_022490 [Coryphaenoides rupestris]|nr:hypothetical protein CRUP_022490 [Coryphaenoides rupestris]